MTTLERLGAMAPLDTTTVEGQQQALMQRMQAFLDDPSTKPPGFETKPLPPDFDVKPIPPEPDMAELAREMARQWWCTEFMQTMLFGDEDQLGTKPEEY
ncbi:hypothetical protein [Stenotrophomonas sp. PD6]|uniref:hypothetical protein n=1 Tax=Stenotrophomonas sp. PD6 TaxID=3368612 RepID=UPI003BA12EF1